MADYYGGIIKGGPEAYKAIAPQVDFTKQQFQNARKSLAQSAPAGGAYASGSRVLASNQAQTVSGLYRDKINEALQRLQEMGTSETSAGLTATGGVQAAGQGLGELAAARAQAIASGIGGISGAFGTFAGLHAAAPPLHYSN